MAVMRAFGPARRLLSAGELGSELGIPRATLSRLLAQMVELGLLERSARLYRPGPAILTLGFGYLSSREVVAVADPILRDLRDDTGCSTHLGVRDGRHVVYLVRHPSRSALTSNIGVGSVLPAETTLMGRLLLSTLASEDLAALYPGADMHAALTAERMSGLGASDGLFEPGVAVAAALVSDPNGARVAAINLVHPAGTLPWDAEKMIAKIQAAAGRISNELGLKVEKQ